MQKKIDHIKLRDKFASAWVDSPECWSDDSSGAHVSSFQAGWDAAVIEVCDFLKQIRWDDSARQAIIPVLAVLKKHIK